MVVDIITPDLTVYLLLNVILTEFIRVVIAGGKESVVTQQIIVPVSTVQTTHVFTKSGQNQMVHRSGDMTGCVVKSTLYLTIHLLNVILTEVYRVVIAGCTENAETQQIIALVRIVQTLHVFIKSGQNQMVHKSGDMTSCVVKSTLYLTVHLLNVILTGRTLVVVNIAFVTTIHLIVYALNVWTTGFLLK